MSSVVHIPSNSSINVSSMHSWYLAPSFANPEAYVSFDELLQPAQQHCSDSDCRTWQAEVDLDDDEFIHHHKFLNHHQPYLDTVLDEVGITTSPNADGFGANYAFIVVWIFFCGCRMHCRPFSLQHLSQRLHASLVATFLDCAPVVFSPSETPPGTEMQLIVEMAQITRTVYSSLLQAPATVGPFSFFIFPLTHKLAGRR